MRIRQSEGGFSSEFMRLLLVGAYTYCCRPVSPSASLAEDRAVEREALDVVFLNRRAGAGTPNARLPPCKPEERELGEALLTTRR